MFLLMTLTSIMFSIMKHPLSMGLMIILQTIMISITLNLMIKSPWYSYILIMIIMGAMMVLFIYMASIASNEKFNSNTIILLLTTIMLTTLGQEYIPFEKYSNFMIEESNQIMSLTKMFNQSMSITIFMVIYLLITMIVITFNVNTFEGPMKSKY